MASTALDKGNCAVLIDNCADPKDMQPFIMLTIRDGKRARNIQSPITLQEAESFYEHLEHVIVQHKTDLLKSE